MKKPADLQLAYLLISTPFPNTYIGGAMVTDGRGLPLEFRYTEPIQPGKIQQILYGQVLSQYIKQEVILETLLKSLESKFKCLLVEDDALLGSVAAASGKGVPVLRVSETQLAPIGQAGSIQENSPGELLLQTAPEASPVRVNLKPATNSNSVSGSAALPEGGGLAGGTATGIGGSSEKPYQALLDAGATMEICEPLRRVEKALEVICQEIQLRAQEG